MTPTDLYQQRLALGLKQIQLAERLGVHEITVSRWERGETPIPPFLHLALEALAHKLTAQAGPSTTVDRHTR